MYLADAAVRTGLPARAFSGLLFAAPYSSTHYWAKFRSGDGWLPAHALLQNGLAA